MKKTTLLATAAIVGSGAISSASASDLDAFADQVNAHLASLGMNIELDYAETLGNAEVDAMGQTIIFKDTGNKQLAFDFVPFDPRRTGLQEIQFIVDDIDTLHTISGTEGEPPVTIPVGADLVEFHKVQDIWSDVSCSNLPINDLGDSGADLGIVQAIFGYGGNPAVIAADVGHFGWLPPSFFDLLQPGGGAGILGVTFTFRFIDGAGNSTDIDNNGVADAAFREIYYNTNFPWTINPNDRLGDGGIDITSVAIHEAGHGLSQAHFGTGRINNKTGKITISPQAIMNAAHTIGHREVTGTDKGGHCSNWASWPNN